MLLLLLLLKYLLLKLFLTSPRKDQFRPSHYPPIAYPSSKGKIDFSSLPKRTDSPMMTSSQTRKLLPAFNPTSSNLTFCLKVLPPHTLAVNLTSEQPFTGNTPVSHYDCPLPPILHRQRVTTHSFHMLHLPWFHLRLLMSPPLQSRRHLGHLTQPRVE